MDCELLPELGSTEHLKVVSERVRRQRVPMSGAFDLTHRCNLRCLHCYAGHLVSESAAQAAELSTAEVLQLLSEAASAGCLFLLLSGGEPLLRRDFVEIYTAACRLGLVVTVFTNATLLNQSHLDAFREYPPRLVEISVYGATERTYEKITGVPGSYGRMIQNIDTLQEQGVRLGLKTMILRENVGEIEAIRTLARDRGLRFRSDPLVTPRLDGDAGPLAQRVDVSQAVDLELSDAARRVELAEFVSRQAAAIEESGTELAARLYRCGAGVTSFHIDPAGVVRPCLMSRALGYDGVRNGFASAWDAVVHAIDRSTGDAAGRCVGCPDILVCGYCPDLLSLETGDSSVLSEYVCELGQRRSELIEQVKDVGV